METKIKKINEMSQLELEQHVKEKRELRNKYPENSALYDLINKQLAEAETYYEEKFK